MEFSVRTSGRQWLGIGVLCLLALAVTMPAQEVTASIFGTVADKSGAVIPNAKVTVTAIDRNQVIRTLTTDASGNYVAPLLPVGRYSVTAEAPGFKRATQAGIELNVNERLTINLELEVGDVAQEVTVEAQAQQVELQNAQQSGLISGTMVRELQLNNRHFAQLLALPPGVVSNTADSMFVGTTNPTGGNNLVAFSVNGQRQSANAWTVDGADILDRGSNLTIINYPSVDAIEEVRVVRSAYSSEFGRAAGGQMSVITRSGTNQFHGTAYEFWRNNNLNANNFFNNRNLRPGPDGKAPRPPLRYHNFGYTLGGPVWIPKLYDGRNKTFFFWSQEFRRVVNFNAAEVILPTANELRGVFSQPVCVGPNGDCTQTATTITNINPAARAYIQDVFSQLPAPGNGSTINSLFVPLRGVFNSRQEMIRVDQNFGSRLQLYGRFLQDNIPTIEPGGLFTNVFMPGVSITETNSPGKTFVGRGTYTISPRMYNEGGYSYSKGGIFSTPTALVNAANSPNVRIPLPFTNTLGRIPSLAFTSGTSITSFGPYNNFSTNHNIFDNFSAVLGRHTVKAGFAWNYYRKVENAAGANAGSFSFTNAPRPAGTNPYSQAWANFLNGFAASFSQTSVDLSPDLRQHSFEGYLQDDFRITRNFTLNMGIRYSNFRQPFEANNQLTNFDPSLYNPARAFQIDPATGNRIPGTGDPGNGIIIAGVNSPYGNKIARENNLNFAPRLGFAWDPFGKGRTSVRAGYGLFFDTALVGILQQNVFTNPAPFVTNVSIANTRLDNPLAGVPVVSAAPVALRAVAPNWKTPYSQQWSVDFQQDLGWQTQIAIAYVGTKGTNLIGVTDLNHVRPGLARDAGLVPANGYITAGAPTNRLNALRPFRGYTAVNSIQPWYNSNYHGLQMNLQKRFSAGNLFNVAYTWSKAMTDAGSDRASAPQNTYDRGAEYALSPLDRRHVLTIAYVYDLPFFKDTQNAIAKYTLGGWQLSGIFNWNTGLPVTVTSALGNDPAGLGFLGPSAAGPRPDRVFVNNLPINQTIDRWIDASTFAEVPVGQARPGNSGRSIFAGPGIVRWDFSIFKQFPIGENVRLQLRGGAFNVLNHTNYNAPISALGNINFGRITTARDPRNIQIGAKLAF